MKDFSKIEIPPGMQIAEYAYHYCFGKEMMFDFYFSTTPIKALLEKYGLQQLKVPDVEWMRQTFCQERYDLMAEKDRQIARIMKGQNISKSEEMIFKQATIKTRYEYLKTLWTYVED